MTSTTKPFTLRWGILGCGHIANDFVRALPYSDNNHVVVAVATSNSLERAEKFRESVGLPSGKTKAYGSYDELLTDHEVDVIYIGVNNKGHCEWTLKALAARKPVLCEKPLGVNSAEVRQMVETARQNNTFLMEAFWSRFFPAWRYIHDVIESEKYGAVQNSSVNFGYVTAAHLLNPADSNTPLMSFGVYTILFAIFVNSKKGAPKHINAYGQRKENGSDLWSNITLDFGDNVYAMCSYNGTAWGPNSAYIVFERGQIQIPEFFWSPTRLIEFDTTTSVGRATPITRQFPLGQRDEDATKFNYPNGPGLRYEADHVFERLRQGETESDILTLDATIRLHETFDRVRKEIGLVFPQDK